MTDPVKSADNRQAATSGRQEAGQVDNQKNSTGGSTGAASTSIWTVDNIIKFGTFIVAIVVIAALAWFIQYLLQNATKGETVWQRYTYLLSGVEAVAFAAAGYLFGKDVHRGTAQQAEQRAEEAKGTANEATQRANREGERVSQVTVRADQVAAVADQNTMAATAYKERFQALNDKVKHMNRRYDEPRTPSILSGVTSDPGGGGLFRYLPRSTDRRITVWMDEPDREGELLADGDVEDLSLIAATQQERVALQKDLDELTALCDRPEIEIHTLPLP
jgi:hypothetical protein